MRRITLLLALGLLPFAGGCGHTELEIRKRASTAAVSKYPGEAKASETFALAAIDREGRDIEIVNLSDVAVPGGTLWVNARFVATVPSIPPRSMTLVPYDHLIEAGAAISDLAREKTGVAKVEFQTPNGLVKVLGPARR